ncbi:MAG: hypothetical protein KKA10_06090 [Euryarchaeota archaeon]|nr:hypothetical protein [Euryarchaeota archaeon]MCG2736371.1 hypothetical protein [Candidatus Methanoperedenaceae archaeon]
MHRAEKTNELKNLRIGPWIKDRILLILRYCVVERTLETVMNVYSRQALDPHVNRYRFRDDWWA